MKHWVILGFLLFQLSLAQLCITELQSVVPEDLSVQATGNDATLLIQRAIEILEPALPRLAYLPDPFDYRDNPSAVYVAEHGLLPAIWEPDTLVFEVWQEMVIGLAAWYDLDIEISQDLSLAGLIQTLASPY